MIRTKRILDSPAVTRGLQLVAALSMILAIVVGMKQYSLASCLQDYQDASAKAAAARTQAAEQDRQAQDALFESIANDPRNSIAALRAYNASRAGADQKRKDNPPPELPSITCG
jgi:hypothetical protein